MKRLTALAMAPAAAAVLGYALFAWACREFDSMLSVDFGDIEADFDDY